MRVDQLGRGCACRVRLARSVRCGESAMCVALLAADDELEPLDSPVGAAVHELVILIVASWNDARGGRPEEDVEGQTLTEHPQHADECDSVGRLDRVASGTGRLRFGAPSNCARLCGEGRVSRSERDEQLLHLEGRVL